MILIVGLGNIGDNYKLTKHNVGFMVLDCIAKFYNLSWKLNFKGLLSEKNFLQNKVIFVKPQTFMNLSGDCVASLCSFYKILPQDVIIIQDDLDLDFGKIKYKTNSGDGGHNGIKDIQNKIGKNIHKIKIGIGRPNNLVDVSSYVLSNFSQNQLIDIEVISNKIINSFDLLIEKKFNEFINNINN